MKFFLGPFDGWILYLFIRYHIHFDGYKSTVICVIIEYVGEIQFINYKKKLNFELKTGPLQTFSFPTKNLDLLVNPMGWKFHSIRSTDCLIIFLPAIDHQKRESWHEFDFYCNEQKKLSCTWEKYTMLSVYVSVQLGAIWRFTFTCVSFLNLHTNRVLLLTLLTPD